MKKEYEIVSLGENCLVRTVLTNHGIKPSKSEGELSCPFDLVLHPIGAVIKNLKDDFAGYFEDLYFAPYKKHMLDFRKKGYWKKTDGTCFFHDKDCKLADREKLINRIEKRINNFNNIMENETPILFIINIRDANNRLYINELFDILKMKRNGKKFVFAVLDLNGIACEKLYPEIEVLNLPLPFDLFHKSWNTRKYRESLLGKYIEECICSFVKNIIEKEFKAIDNEFCS